MHLGTEEDDYESKEKLNGGPIKGRTWSNNDRFGEVVAQNMRK